jgi:hypothetical protein
MKNINKHILSIGLLFIVMLVNGGVKAQTSFMEGSLFYNISIISEKSETPGINSLNGATLQVFLNPNQSRTEMKSSVGIETTVFDSKLKKGFILKEYSGQKLMISMNAANWVDKNKLYESLQFIISDERSMIGNYSCKKATASLPDGKMFIVYSLIKDVIEIFIKLDEAFTDQQVFVKFLSVFLFFLCLSLLLLYFLINYIFILFRVCYMRFQL